jgi:Leucine rich repeat
MHTINIFLAFLLLHTFAQEVTIRPLKLECKTELTSMILCHLPRTTNYNEVTRIAGIVSLKPRDLTVQSIQESQDVDIAGQSMTERMPLDLGSAFENMNSLAITRTGLKILQRSNFEMMKKLRALNLYENVIESLPSDVFYELIGLEYLDIDGNQIEELHDDLLIYMPSLVVFRASHNRIEAVGAGFLRKNLNIREVHLSENRLKRVLVDFTPFSQLVVVDLEGNVGGCDFNYGYNDDDWIYSDDDYGNYTITWFQMNVDNFCRIE